MFFKNAKGFTRQCPIRNFTYMTSRKHRGQSMLFILFVVINMIDK